MPLGVAQTVAEGVLLSGYVFLLIIIVTSKVHVLKTAFYTVFVATGVADVLAIMVSCFSRLNRQLGLGPEFKGIMPFTIMMSGTTFLTHMIGNMLLTINRYSALCFLKKYDKIWTRRNVWIMIVAQYVVAFAAYSHMIGAEVLYKQGDDGAYTFAGVDSGSSWV
ncbi:hypothetical protein COOONC_20343 [Cooperia oncophora]